MSLTNRHGKPRQCDCGNAATRVAVGNSYQCDRCAGIEAGHALFRRTPRPACAPPNHRTIPPMPSDNVTFLNDLEACPLHKNTPFGITDVSMSQFSIARHSGGCTFNGDNYIYIPETDELIRCDVLKWKNKEVHFKP